MSDKEVFKEAAEVTFGTVCAEYKIEHGGDLIIECANSGATLWFDLDDNLLAIISWS